MRYYHSYMDRQGISAETHEKLINLDVPRRTVRHSWVKYGALAACAALVLGVGAWGLNLGAAPGTWDGPRAAVNPTVPVQTEGVGQLQIDETPAVPDGQSFVVNSPVAEDPMAFYYMPGIYFRDVTDTPETAASRAFVPGSFTVDLTLEDVQKLFWGPEGVPETYRTEVGRQDLPWALFWDGYTVHGYAWYDGQGQFTELILWGEKGKASFTLELRLGALPFTCCVDMSRGDETSEFNGVEITGWSRVYDRDGDGQADYICGSEFMLPNDIGVRFVSQNCGTADDPLDGEAWFNTLFVRETVVGGLHLDHLMTAESIPAWRYETFDTLEQAREETDFAPYLPAAEPEGYSAYAGHKDFSALLNYREGNQNMLFVRWGRGYDNVEVDVYLPEGNSTACFDPVDISVPESYDTRLYELPWCDSVPEEYIVYFLSTPVFRAEDMSLDIVEARETPHDTGGVSYHFSVLHPNGVVVDYSCDGMTAQQVWEMVETTLQ